MNPELPHFSEDLNLIDNTVLLLLRELVLQYAPSPSERGAKKLKLNNVVLDIYENEFDENLAKRVKKNSTTENLSDQGFREAVDYYTKYAIFQKYHDFFFIIELLELDQLSSKSENPEVVRLYNKYNSWKKDRSGRELPQDIESLLYQAEERRLKREVLDFNKIINLIYAGELTEATDDKEVRRLCIKFRKWRGEKSGKNLPQELVRRLFEAQKYYDSTKWVRRKQPTKIEA
jgi:hypothetical protein